MITALAAGTGTSQHELLWYWSLSKVFVHLHAAAVYNGTATRWTGTDPTATAALRQALASRPPPQPTDDPFALAEGEDD